MTLRTLRPIGLASALLATLPAHALPPTPEGGTLSPAATHLEFTGSTQAGANLLSGGSASPCFFNLVDCDQYALTVDVPATYAATHPAAKVKLNLAMEFEGDDYDVYVVDAATGETVAAAIDGYTLELPAGAGLQNFTVDVVPVIAYLNSYTVQIDLKDGTAPADADGDGVPDAADQCADTPAGTPVDATGCEDTSGGGNGSAYDQVPSNPSRPRVVVADMDSGINPYHENFYAHGSQVTKEVLAALGVKPENVVRLTRTGETLADDLESDAEFWAGVKRGELYHFLGTNIIAVSYAAVGDAYLKPDTSKSAHGVGTASSVVDANPEAILLFVEQNTELGSAESHAFSFNHPEVDIVTTSYGVSVPAGPVGSTGIPVPEYSAFESTFDGVVRNGKLHFSSGGNGPGLTFQRAGAGPWWSIGVTAISEGESNGKETRSGSFADFVADFFQDIPYCMDCKTGREEGVGGTSFSTPTAAGVASRVLLEARRAAGHVGGIKTVDGKKLMVAAGGVSISNWFLRRALEQGAHVPTLDSYSYDNEAPAPINPVAPWLQVGWGNLTFDPAAGVVPAALSHLGLGNTPREKEQGFCDFQTSVIQYRKAFWGQVSPQLPAAPVIGGETPPVDQGDDPFIYCASSLPGPLFPASNDPGNPGGGGEEPSEPPQLCAEGVGCISQVPGAGPAIQGAVDTAYTAATGGEVVLPGGGTSPVEPASCAAGANLEGDRSYHVTLTTFDGEQNSFQVFEPTTINCAGIASGAHPLMLQGHGYGGSRNTGVNDFRQFRDAGYTVISIDQRGFGETTGTVRTMDPGFEGKYLLQILDWAEANLDYLAWRNEANGAFVARPADHTSVANGVNLVVGATGGSYGGGYQLLILAVDAKKRLDAIQPDITWHDLRNALSPGDVPKTLWGLALAGAGEGTSQAAQLQAGAPGSGQDPFIKETLARASATNEFPRQALDWFRYHSLSHWCGASGLPTMPFPAYGTDTVPMLDVAGSDNVPAPQPDGRPGVGLLNVPANPLTHFQGLGVLLTQGLPDTLFNFNESWWNYQCLTAAGADVKLYTHTGGHALPYAQAPDGFETPVGGAGCSANTLGWFNSKLKGDSEVAVDNVCFVLAAGDTVSMDAEQVLAPQPSLGLTGGQARGFVERDVVGATANGLAASYNVLGANGTAIELGTVEQAGILAGIPHLDLDVVNPAALVNDAVQDCAEPAVPTLRTGCDSILFVGLGIQPADGMLPRPKLIDDQLQPVRGVGRHSVDLVGVAERLNVGDRVFLMVFGQHAQFFGGYSRDLTIPAVNLNGTVKLPIYGANEDGSPNFRTGQRVLDASFPLDSDEDGVSDETDNCTMVANTDQANLDGDADGDACDTDIDGDGVANAQDAFPRDSTETTDTDADGTGDNADNCVDVANADQADTDADGTGDACEDATPDAFAFNERSNVATRIYVTSETLGLVGFDAPAAITIDAASQYSINGGDWTSAAGTFAPGDTLAVRHISAMDAGTAVESSVTVGGTTAVFRSVTGATDRTPDAFSFGTQTRVAPGAVVESISIVPTGYNTRVSVVAGPGAEYRIDGTGEWTSAAGWLLPGQSIQARHTATTTAGELTKTTVKVGGIPGLFRTRTR